MVNLPVSEVMHVEPPTLEIYRYSVANATKLYLLNTIAPTYYFSNVLFLLKALLGIVAAPCFIGSVAIP